MGQRKPGQKSIADIKKLYYLLLSSSNIQALIMGDANLDFYFSDKKVQYIFLDKSIKIEI